MLIKTCNEEFCTIYAYDINGEDIEREKGKCKIRENTSNGILVKYIKIVCDFIDQTDIFV